MGMITPAEETPSRVLATTERELNKANVGFLAIGAFVALLSICIAGIIREGVNFALPHLSPNSFDAEILVPRVPGVIVSLVALAIIYRTTLKVGQEEWKQAREIAALPGQEATE